MTFSLLQFNIGIFMIVTVIYLWRFIITRTAMLNAGRVSGIKQMKIEDSIAYRAQRLSYFIEWLLQCLAIVTAGKLAFLCSSFGFPYVVLIVFGLLLFFLNAVIYIIAERLSNIYIISTSRKYLNHKGQVK